MSLKLFPQIAHMTVVEQIGRTPYLDLQWQFLDVTELARRADETKPYVTRGQKFSVWNAERDRKLSPIISYSPPDAQFHKLDRYSDYVLGLHASDFKAKHLTDLCRRFQQYIETDLIEEPVAISGAVISSLLLAPLLKWRASAQNVSRDLVDSLEDIINAISAKLRRAFNADLLTIQNWIFFTYIVIADIAAVGISATVGCYFLKVFRSTSTSKWIATRTDIRVQFAALMLAFTMRFYELEKPFETKLGFSHSVLAELRSVFQEAGNAELEATFTPSQWIFRWLVDKLDAEVFSPLRRTEISGLAALSPTEQNLAVELVRRFATYRVPITVESLAGFLLQFGTTQRIRGALRLLAHVKFYPLWELAHAIERTLAAELNRTGEEKLVISAFGEHTGSAAIMNYLIAHSPLASALKFEPNLPAALAATPTDGCIYIVDDCLLSGTQGLNTLGDLMGTRLRKSHHTLHAPELSTGDKRRLKNRHLRFTYGVVMDEGIKRFQGKDYAKTGLDKRQAKVLFGTIEPSSSKIFNPLGPVGWLSEEERDDMKAFCEEIGYNVLERRSAEKAWTDNRRKESALGFSDMQRLLVFPYNVPKTTLTLLWERSIGDFKWNPLFPGFD
ncbi:hypothetical protein B0G80_7342 [Paraburkholderia sp. BL6669N2]|uniref:phosphoribosyltransferase-like protein n=1 Tax=Paraburkholderia sp. BL6669N2 TaxID=1938807 RepID=UPI000E39290E|nr:hypothetical protein [Paraburkholderia sp. BL6669N2]REG50878.1 hypothetical protein B0G80_7342 [Paraburkholderia sp. BL6669N2]